MHKERNRPSLPPGPKPFPLLGNILSIDPKEPWITYTKWRDVFGNLIYVKILNQEVIIINSYDDAEALLDKRSRIYSDRPYLATRVPFGWSFLFALMNYGDEWRLNRRLVHQTFRPESAVKFHPIQIKQAREMILNLIEDSEHYHSHIATFSSSIVMLIVYGYQPSARGDPRVRIMENALELGLMMTPERAAILDAFPFLLRIPDWCWGSSIKRSAQISTDRMTEMINLPFQGKQQMADDSILSQSSMVAENLQRMENQDEALKPAFEIALKNSAASAVVGAYETVRRRLNYHVRCLNPLQSTATMMVFTLAMMLYPDVQKRAQAEIDSVVGKYRLPTFEDRDSLPYVNATMREVLRWGIVAPLGTLHATSEEDSYNGYLIPKGAAVIFNGWAITRDETRYPHPSHFMPERFLDVNGKLTNDDPAQYVFGLGRRICPGRHVADGTLWAGVVTVLATLDISTAKDDQGRVIDFTPDFGRPGLTRCPVDFPCSISVRPHVQAELMDALRTAE